jgi:hypothetical protein
LITPGSSVDEDHAFAAVVWLALRAFCPVERDAHHEEFAIGEFTDLSERSRLRLLALVPLRGSAPCQALSHERALLFWGVPGLGLRKVPDPQ